MRITVNTHSFIIDDLKPGEIHIVKEYLGRLVEYGKVKRGKRLVNVPVRTYACASKNRKRFNLHISDYPRFILHLRQCGVPDSDITIVKRKLNKKAIQRIELTPKNLHTPRDYQLEPIEYVLNDNERSKMVALQTGRGKTFVALYSAYKLGVKTLITMKGGFVDQWIDVVDDMFDLEPDDLVNIGSTDGLIRYMLMCLEDPSQGKIVFIPNRIYHNYLKHMEDTNFAKDKYPITPDDFHELMGFGFVIKDEVHMEFHGNFRQYAYTHVDKTLGLSATLESKDSFIQSMYDKVYPPAIRNDGGGFIKYIDVIAALYGLNIAPNINCVTAQGYSHMLFEQSIMASPPLLERYLDMLGDLFLKYFDEVYQDKQRCLLFCASIDLCTLLTAYLKKRFPKYTIERFVAEDPESNLYESDVCVSTLGSAGTARDVEHLRTVIMSSSVDSKAANNQAVGRLRPLKAFPDVTPTFVYVSCRDIPKQYEYHLNKPEMFNDKTNGIDVHYIATPIDEGI